MSAKTLAMALALLIVPAAWSAAEAIRLDNPFPAGHRLQPVSSIVTVTADLLPPGQAISVETLDRYVGLKDAATGELLPVQWSGVRTGKAGEPARATVNYVTDLPAKTTKVLEVVGKLDEPAPPAAGIAIAGDARAKVVEVRAGGMAVLLAGDGSAQPPIVGFCRLLEGRTRGGKLPWIGGSRFVDTGPVQSMTIQQSSVGPVFYRQTNRYKFASGTIYTCEITCWAELNCLTIRDRIDGPGAERACWEFDLGNWPRYMYISRYWGQGSFAEFALAEMQPGKEIARMPHYMVWSAREEAVISCFTRLQAPGGTDAAPTDDSALLSIFQIRRGTWTDKLWEPYATRPLSDFPDIEWTTHRWWGSPFSALRIERNAGPEPGALFQIPLCPGDKQWGLWLGDVADLNPLSGKHHNPPTANKVRVAVGELRLNEVQDYVLDWAPAPASEHPRIHMTRTMLEQFDRKAESHPYFAQLAEELRKDPYIVAWRNRDEGEINRLAQKLANRVRKQFISPNIFTGLNYSHDWNPVGARWLFHHVVHTDILLGTGLVRPELQKQLRAQFAMIAYRLMDPSFMSWKYNAGHPNFDADRYTTIAIIGLLYPEHPQAKVWVEHCLSRIRESMRIYMIPSSGKWAENVGGYYMWVCHIFGGLGHALRLTGAADPYAWPEFQNFWKWAVLPVMPKKPARGDMAAICSDNPPGQIRWERQLPSIGDGGSDGGSPLHGGLALAGAYILEHNPQFGANLLWAWSQGGKHNLSHHHYSMFFGLTKKDLETADNPASEPKLKTRRLEGYGAVLRADVGKDTESYLLFKCGPGGYRYHYGEEGSFVLFGLGAPLSLDGGGRSPQAHSTVSFGEQRAALYRGRVANCRVAGSIQYVCGDFPARPEQVLTKEQQQALPQLRGWGRDVTDFPGARSVMRRQILMCHNDYVVIRDTINSIQNTQWYLHLFSQEITPSRGRVVAKGWLGVDVTVSLFHAKPGEGLVPVEPDAIAIEPAGFRGIKQQRITVSQPAGVGVVAVIDFHKAGEPPWDVAAEETSLVLKQGGVTETVEMFGPQVRWKADAEEQSAAANFDVRPFQSEPQTVRKVEPAKTDEALAAFVEVPWVEKTIVRQAGGGLIVTIHNPRDAAVYCPMNFPKHDQPQITPLSVPRGASVGRDHLTLLAGQRLVFAVK